MNFKKGDKVRILPSAVDASVPEDEVGKTGIITNYHSLKLILVLMDKPRMENGHRFDWCIESHQIEPIIKVGQQLLLFEL